MDSSNVLMLNPSSTLSSVFFGGFSSDRQIQMSELPGEFRMRMGIAAPVSSATLEVGGSVRVRQGLPSFGESTSNVGYAFQNRADTGLFMSTSNPPSLFSYILGVQMLEISSSPSQLKGFVNHLALGSPTNRIALSVDTSISDGRLRINPDNVYSLGVLFGSLNGPVQNLRILPIVSTNRV